jgi:DNA ligase-1
MKDSKTKIEIGEAIESMNPVFLRAADDEIYREIITTHGGLTLAEIKQDGYRLQIHKKDDKIKAFTRSLNEVNLSIFPELQASLNRLPDCIIDSEITGLSLVGYEGFQSIKKRFRSKMSPNGLEEYLKSGLIEQYPVELTVFDTLYWESQILIGLPLTERRKFTEKILEKKLTPSVQKKFTNPRSLEEWFLHLVQRNYEGLVCKRPDSLYLPGKETKDWIKLKRAETLDLVVLGVYLENNVISQVLCGPYNNKQARYETLAKLNAKREGLNKELAKMLGEKLIKTKPSNIFLNPNIKKHEEQMPSFYVRPENSVVVEVASMNCNYGKNTWHSCGYSDNGAYSLRIAWLKRIRDDKKIQDVSTIEKVKAIYSRGVQK